jgi:hypothetical protein
MVAHQTLASILIAGGVALVLTFLLSLALFDSRRNWPWSAHFMLLIPAVAAGTTSAGVFQHSFETAFSYLAADVTSICITAGLYAALPQLIVAIALGLLYRRLRSREVTVSVQHGRGRRNGD